MTKSNEPKIFKYRRLAPLWIAVFIDILGFSLLFPMVGFFREEFNTTNTVIGLVFSVNAMFGFVFGFILGRLSDRYGRKPLLLISQFGTLLAFILTAFSNTLLMLFIARMVDGIFGGNFPIAKAIVSDVVPPKDRGIQMANIGVSHVLANLIGPGVGGILFTFFGIVGPALFASGLTIITIILTFLLLQESWPKEKRLLHHEFKIEIDDKIKNNKNAKFFLILFGFHSVSFMITMSSVSFFGATVLGLNPLEIAILLTTSGIFRAVIRFTLFKPTIRKFGEDNAIRIGLTMFTISFFLLGFATNLIVLFILFMTISFAASLTRGPLNSKISQTVSPKIQGKINGLSSSLDANAQILGPLIGPFIIDNLPPYWLGIIVGLIALPPFIMGFQNIAEKRYIPKESELSSAK